MASETEIRAALAWETETQPPADKSTWEWLWEAIQGDFNDNRSTGQVAFDAAVSMIPVVDQICDVRDIIANCKNIAQSEEKEDNTWKWVALVLTLIGLFPTLGSLLKGVLKIFFAFVRRYGLDKLIKAVDDAMTWVITFLRKREVQDYLRLHKVDEVFKWLADAARAVRGKINPRELLAAFDTSIGIMKSLLEKVTWIPRIGERAKRAMETVDSVRRMADAQLGKALAPVQTILDRIIHKLDMEHMAQRSGILNASNVHFRGALPEARAVTLMRNAEPPPSWLSRGQKGKWAEQDIDKAKEALAKHPGWPRLSNRNIESFHTMAAVEIKGPAKLFRVTSPSNGAMGDCWVPEDVWNKIMAKPDPKAAWRKYSAVWPDWNPNGQFVVLEIKAGDSLKAWRGPAASQSKKNLPNAHLEGGWDQVVVKVEGSQWDTTRYYMRGGGHGEVLHPPGLSRAEYEQLSDAKKIGVHPDPRENQQPRHPWPARHRLGADGFRRATARRQNRPTRLARPGHQRKNAMTPNLFDNPLAAGSAFPLSLWQKRQAALLYYWMSLDYLKGLKGMIDKLIAGADVLLDVAKSQGRDALVTDARWGVRDTSANWSTYGHSALEDFRKSTIKDIALRASESYEFTGANQCGYLLDETSSRWMTSDEEDAFKAQAEAVFSYAHQIDAAAGKGGRRRLDDSSMVAYWQDYAGRFPRLPKFRVRTDVVGETGKRPPRTGVYVPQDDPYGTLQFAWTGNSNGILGEVQTFNDAGLAGVKAIGRDALWRDEPKMMAYVIDALKQKHLRPYKDWMTTQNFSPEDVARNRIDWKDVDDLIAARLVLSEQVYVERPCKWYFVEMIEGEFDDAVEDEASTAEPTRRPNVPAGQPCPEAGWWFTPVQSGSRRYFKQGDAMPSLGGDYGETFWQWSQDQSAPKL